MSGLALVTASSALLEMGGPVLAWTWSTLKAELALLPPGTIVLCADDQEPGALVWGAATEVGLRRLSLRSDGRRVSSYAAPGDWAGKNRNDALIGLLTKAREAGWSVGALALVGGKVSNLNDTAKRIAAARRADIEVRVLDLPRQLGGVAREVAA